MRSRSGAPTSVELKQIDSPSKVAFPKSAVVEYQFPARGKMPPLPPDDQKPDMSQVRPILMQRKLYRDPKTGKLILVGH